VILPVATQPAAVKSAATKPFTAQPTEPLAAPPRKPAASESKNPWAPRVEPIAKAVPLAASPVPELTEPTYSAESTHASALDDRDQPAVEQGASPGKLGFLIGALISLAWFVFTGLALILLGAPGLVIGGVAAVVLIGIYRLRAHNRHTRLATAERDHEVARQPNVDLIDTLN